MPYYSRRGDDGTTAWLGKGRLPKNDARIEAVGTLDEASAAIGLARATARDRRTPALLLEAQRDLYLLMAEASAAPEDSEYFRFEPKRVEWLEKQIDVLGQGIPMPGEFIVPGDSPAGAALDLARAIVRRAERRIVQLSQDGQIKNAILQQYLNRLSSLLFVLELAENEAAGESTTFARRHGEGSAP